MRHGYFIMTIATAVAALMIGVAAVRTGAVDGPPHRFHVDYEHGNDANDGTTPRTAWKHAPGDAAASGRPNLTNLIPGDHVIFAGGVVYRGAIRITASGTPEKPIVFEARPTARPPSTGRIRSPLPAARRRPIVPDSPPGPTSSARACRSR